VLYNLALCSYHLMQAKHDDGLDFRICQCCTSNLVVSLQLGLVFWFSTFCQVVSVELGLVTSNLVVSLVLNFGLAGVARNVLQSYRHGIHSF